MQKILYWNDGIEIFYNGHENIQEILFELDENNSICNTFKIFPTNFTYNNEKYDTEIKNISGLNNHQHNIDKGFLFYSFIYQKSLGHFLGNTLPKITNYLEICKNTNENIPIIVPRICYNVITKNILELLNIENIIILEDKHIYTFNSLITIPHYTTVPDTITDKHIEIYNLIREKLNIKNENDKKRKIYLKRDNIKNIEYGNDETGNYRQIMNESELIDKLTELGFEIITLGTSTIIEKKNLLSNADIVITPLGANCFNFIFSNSPNNIIYISNQDNFGDEWYTNLINTLNRTSIKGYTLRFESLKHLCDPKNDNNSPFYVNIQQIINLLDSIREN
jgi:capsular polysaccharide biosynthesis protein